MRNAKQRSKAQKYKVEMAKRHAEREQEVSARAYAHARMLYESGETTAYTQGLAAKTYRNVQTAQNHLQYYVDGTLRWSYKDLGY